MSQPVLEYRSISKTYRSFLGEVQHRALRDFSVSVFPGEIVGFLGPNGAGKTTAIHIALGLTKPSAGEGRLLGEPFGHVQSRRRVGFLAENVSFYHFSALDVVRFYGRLNGVREPELSRRAKDLLARLDLADVARGRSVAKFSRGMLQRVGLAQALVNDPDLLILDEPTSALDPGSRLLVRNVLTEARRQGKSVFLSSHMLSELEMVCDRVVLLDHGRVVLEGKTGELLESADRCEIVVENSARFQPPVNADEVSREGERLSFVVGQAEQRAAIEAAWKGGAVLVSVTPARRTLEQIFLSVTAKAESRDGGAA